MQERCEPADFLSALCGAAICNLQGKSQFYFPPICTLLSNGEGGLVCRLQIANTDCSFDPTAQLQTRAAAPLPAECCNLYLQSGICRPASALQLPAQRSAAICICNLQSADCLSHSNSKRGGLQIADCKYSLQRGGVSWFCTKNRKNVPQTPCNAQGPGPSADPRLQIQIAASTRELGCRAGGGLQIQDPKCSSATPTRLNLIQK